MKWLGPKLFCYAARKTEARFKEQFGQYAQQNKTEGNENDPVVMNKKTSQKKASNKNVGEYIDFEDIE